MAILVTGGAGYIGSHTCVELLNAGYDVVVVDNLCNSCKEALDRVQEITGKTVKFYETDVLDREGLNRIFDAEKIDSVIHFAGLKAVGESVAKPLEYYHNNITGTLILCDVMRSHGVKSIVFQFFSNRLRNACLCSDHRGVSEGHLHESLWLDQIHAGADFNRYAYGRRRVEGRTSSLF